MPDLPVRPPTRPSPFKQLTPLQAVKFMHYLEHGPDLRAPSEGDCEACGEPERDAYGDAHRCLQYTCAYCGEKTDNADLLCDACDGRTVDDGDERDQAGFEW